MGAPINDKVSKLGFGMMRLPTNEGAIEIDKVCAMTDLYMEKGFNYFDTAYVYGDGASENAVRDAVCKRHPRDSFFVADKMPMREGMTTHETLPKLFATSLERTGAGYFDFYLLHALNDGGYKRANETGAWEFLREQKEKGLIRHAGFSFHDKAAVLDKILTEHPEVEFVQLQINYADWDNDQVQSRLCYETARKHGIPIIVMEPVKGGSLNFLPDQIREKLIAMDPSMSIASWAIRYVETLDGILTVLSGMSTIEQVQDNVSFMENFIPLTSEQMDALMDISREIAAIPGVPCTKCRYCVDGCPMKIDIPAHFGLYNDYMRFRNPGTYFNRTKYLNDSGSDFNNCIKCGLCASVCPQHINIPNELEKLKEIKKQ